MATPTNQEQLFLELINRARLDPAAEAIRYGIDLNKDLAAGTITTAQKQPLTFNEYLGDSADAHTAWMLDNDIFSHTGVNGSSSHDRMVAAGYAFAGSWMSGENLAWAGSSGGINADAYVLTLFQNLFLSSGHRTNTLKEGYKEVGVGAAAGQFNSGGTNFNSLMVTENFAVSGTATFVTGVTYSDTDNNQFYSIGEGQGGITTELTLNSTALGSADSWSSGGYSLGTTSTGVMKITFSGGALGATMGATFSLGTTNVKIDLVNGNTIQASVSATLTDAALNLTLLGINGTDGTGNGLANSIMGNSGANTLQGLGGNDTLDGKAGGDTYIWHTGDGSDIINDTSVSLAEIDILVLSNVASAGVDLYKLGSDLRITIVATGEIITVKNQFNAATLGDGIETLSFSGGVNWTAADITSHLAPPPPINGTAGADVLVGASDADFIYGLAGNDILSGLAGADLLNGGDGTDTVSYGASTAAVIVNLASGVASGGDAAGDTFVEIENISGSGFNDILTGNSGDNRLDGGSGADSMTGGLGDDTYVVDVATDKVTELASQGTDTIETALATFSLSALTAVENLTYTGIANFTGTGNALANSITGGSGNDILNGGLGADLLTGGAGDDTYVVDNAGDVVNESSGTGTDLVQSSVSFDLSDGAHALGDVEKLTLTGSSAINGTGNALANTITGNGGANVIEGKGGADILDGGAGIDTLSYASSADGVTVILTGATASVLGGLGDAAGDSIKNFENIIGSAAADSLTGDGAANVIDGGAGADTMAGGLGNDTYVVDDAGDIIIEALSAGTDLVKSFIGYSLVGSNLENLTLLGSDNIDATGNALANILTGNSGDNRLDGGSGADSMTGGLGDDTYVVDVATDKVTELASQGTDTIETALATFSLSALTAVENLTYTGIANFTGTGNALANSITGGSGNDILNGGLGADLLTGGAGDDTYVVDNAGDVVNESSGTGTDLVQSSVSFDLSDGAHALGDVEKLTLTGSSAINGTGNALANTITGNGGANVIEGKGGADILDGGAGIDTLSYASSADGVTVILTGATASVLGGLGDAAGDSIKNFENIIGSAAADSLTGDGAANVIDGGAGADTMAGGLGNDTYVVDDAGDIIIEALSAGTDLVKSFIGYSLVGSNLENLTLLGSDNIDATGNALANILTGNSGDNRLDGGSGADSMTGGLGDDTYVVDVATDKVTELASQGTDTIETALATFSLSALTAVENLTYTGIANFTGTGNALANSITGGSGNDSFTGGAGGDTFVFNVATFGDDKITDYQDGLDKLSFTAAIADSFDDFTIAGNGTKSVTISHGLDSIILTSGTAFTLDASDFIFV